MSQDRERTRLRQALWIAAGVVVLTVLVIIVSWLSAGSGPAEDAGLAPVAPVTTTQVEHPTFTPETPGGSRSSPSPPEPAPLGTEDLPPGPSIPPSSVPAPPPPAPSPSPASLPAARPAPPVKTSPATPVGAFGVQVGAFSSEASVREMRAKLERLGYRVVTQPTGKLTRVIAAGYPDRAAAQRVQETLRSQGLSSTQVVPLQ